MARSIDEILATIHEWKFAPKTKYGPDYTGCKISRISDKKGPIQVQIGEDPNDDPENEIIADKDNTIQTHFGISVFKEKDDKNAQNATMMPPGVPQYQQPPQLYFQQQQQLQQLQQQQKLQQQQQYPQYPQNDNNNNNNNQQLNQQQQDHNNQQSRKSIDLHAGSIDSKIYSFFKAVENRIRTEAKSKSLEWFGTPSISDELLGEKFPGIITHVKKEGPIPGGDKVPDLSQPYINAKIDTKYCKVRVAKLNGTLVDGTTDDIQKKSYLTVNLSIGGVYFMKGQSNILVRQIGVVINVVSCLVYEQQEGSQSFGITVPTRYRYIEHPENDEENDETNEETMHSKKRPASSAIDHIIPTNKKQKTEQSNNEENQQQQQNQSFVMPGQHIGNNVPSMSHTSSFMTQHPY